MDPAFRILRISQLDRLAAQVALRPPVDVILEVLVTHDRETDEQNVQPGVYELVRRLDGFKHSRRGRQPPRRTEPGETEPSGSDRILLVPEQFQITSFVEPAVDE